MTPATYALSMKSKLTPYSVTAALAGQPDTEMLDILREHDASIAELETLKTLHPDVSLIGQTIATYRQSREIATGLLELPERARRAALAKTAQTASSRT